MMGNKQERVIMARRSCFFRSAAVFLNIAILFAALTNNVFAHCDTLDGTGGADGKNSP